VLLLLLLLLLLLQQQLVPLVLLSLPLPLPRDLHLLVLPLDLLRAHLASNRVRIKSFRDESIGGDDLKQTAKGVGAGGRAIEDIPYRITHIVWAIAEEKQSWR
jgi:hypothetical protein